jgi:SET domain
LILASVEDYLHKQVQNSPTSPLDSQYDLYFIMTALYRLALLPLGLLLHQIVAFTVPASPFWRRPSTENNVHATVVAPFPTRSLWDSSENEGDAAKGLVPESMGQEHEPEIFSTGDGKLEHLCKLLGGSPAGLLRFKSTSDGVRGVYLTRPVKKDEIVLRLPLESCLQDASAPAWITWENGNDEVEPSSYNPGDWATRLAACLLNQQLTRNVGEGWALWLSFLPDPEYLRASLPVHWSEKTVESARSTSLELAVDSAYFGRAEAVEDLMYALKLNSGLVCDLDDNEIRRLCHNALDVVQTRSCRLTQDSDDRVPMRVLAPVFDFINHGSIKVGGDSGANTQFQREGDHLVVRATHDLRADEEILIDYGASARPAWRCLLSYGFVPQYTPIPGPHEDATVDSEDEDNEAEVFMDGTRYIVGPSQVPLDMVAAVFENDRATGDEDDEAVVSLTPEVASKLAKRISDVAYYLLLDEEDESSYATPFDVISIKQAAALRWSQHRVLLACALGLRELAA